MSVRAGNIKWRTDRQTDANVSKATLKPNVRALENSSRSIRLDGLTVRMPPPEGWARMKRRSFIVLMGALPAWTSQIDPEADIERPLNEVCEYSTGSFGMLS